MASDNESKKRETLADIVADMRKAGALMPAAYMRDLLNYADRIEAAAKRERAEIEANALAVGGLVEADRQRVVISKTETTTVGNAAAMREALCDIVILTMKVGYSIHGDVACGIIESKAEHALSAPPRNCDRYEDAASAYADFIVPWKLDGHLDDVPTLQDFSNWLFAQADERKGEGNGR